MQVLLLSATAVAALTNWWARLQYRTKIESLVKPLVTMLVIGLAIANDAEIRYSGIAVLALVLCLEGDIALLPAVNKFVLGLTSFLLGHLLFIVLFARYQMSHTGLAAMALAVVVVFAATVGRRVVRNASRADAKLRMPVTAYLVVISAMAVAGWATGRGWVIAGTTLFVVSDTLLGFERFPSAAAAERSRWHSVAVMVTYHAAIVSLALSLW